MTLTFFDEEGILFMPPLLALLGLSQSAYADSPTVPDNSGTSTPDQEVSLSIWDLDGPATDHTTLSYFAHSLGLMVRTLGMRKTFQAIKLYVDYEIRRKVDANTFQIQLVFLILIRMPFQKRIILRGFQKENTRRCLKKKFGSIESINRQSGAIPKG